MKIKGVINYSDNIVFSPIPSDEDYELIKQMMPSNEVSKDSLFVYKVLLCDNMLDRDNERFTHKALEQLTKLYIGKIGIEDHNPTVKNSHSRIYKTELITDDTIKNDIGEPYEYVLGYAYTINNEKNKSLIEEIKSGLKKEVSVGVSNNSLICSICGHQLGEDGCTHIEGNIYENVKCVGLMDNIDDVYEWSFVSIPSQRKAGVIKSKQVFNMKKEDKLMSLKAAALKIIKSANVAPEDAEELLEEIDKVDKPDKAMKELQDENEKLRIDLEKAMKEVEENKVRRTEEFIDRLIDSMKPKNEKMRALARRAIEELIRVDDDGKLTDESERAIRDELESDEYRPLFKSGDPDYNEDTHAIDEAAALEEEREEVINRLESGQYSGFGKNYRESKSKDIDFSRTTSKAKSQNYTQKTGVMGIHFRDKE